MRTLPQAQFSTIAKFAAALLLAAAADQLFYNQWIGSTLGGFALGWALALAALMPAVRRRPAARIAVLLAIVFALILIENPRLIGAALFWTALSSAAILSRARFGDVWRLAQRLLLHIGFGMIRLLDDGVRYFQIRAPRRGWGVARIASTLIVPVVGGGIFLGLFASANPLIADTLGRITIPSPVSAIPHLVFAAVALVIVWPSLRPHPRMTGIKLGHATLESVRPGLPLATIVLSLITFNAVFALQNVLDIIFLWSNAPLPGTITMADYAHRGAYALIATALLAGLFVLTMLRPGSPSATPAVKALVTLWVAQNLLLVASSILRTLDYIGSYSLTVMRLSAIAWMGLVGMGLALVCWRLLREKSAAWLLNANALAAGIVLAAFCIADPAAIAANWNVRHAREVGGPGQPIDLCYLREQGPAALLPLIELERRAPSLELQDRARAIREDVLRATEQGQSDWHGWTARNARRLAAARAALAPNPASSAPAPFGRNCNGARYAEDPLAPPPALPEASERY